MVESTPLPEGTIRLDQSTILRFGTAVFERHGVEHEQALLTARVLLSADMRGIRSHGIARLPYFSLRLERGVIEPSPEMVVRRLSPTTCSIDAANGLGTVAAATAMEHIIDIATEYGAGFATVTRSNHFGYAGYWAELAMDAGMIGIALGNSGSRVTPTFGAESLLGTNPLAVGVPGNPGENFLLDMATSTVAVGKIETALREARPLPSGWVSSGGAPPVLDDRGTLNYDAPLLPLGGEGDTTGGHKGYGLSLMVELLCGALAGSPLEARLRGATADGSAAMGHFFGAIRVDGFRNPAEVAGDMAATFDTLRGARKAPGHDRIYIAGELETLAAGENERFGIPVTPALLSQMQDLDARLGLGFDL